MYSGRTDERMYTVTGRKTSVLSISHDCKFIRTFFVNKFWTFPCGVSRTKTPPACVPFSCVFYKCFLFYGDHKYTFYVLCHRCCALVYRPSMILFLKKSLIIIDRFNSILSINQNDFRDSFVNEVNVIPNWDDSWSIMGTLTVCRIMWPWMRVNVDRLTLKRIKVQKNVRDFAQFSADEFKSLQSIP